MALTKETVVDKIEVLEMGQVQVRTATRVKEDGAVLSSSFHRHVVVPSVKTGDSWADTDISKEDARVQAVATATWTDSVKTAYQKMIDAQTPKE
jgi:K+-transporting ATPase c subunit